MNRSGKYWLLLLALVLLLGGCGWKSALVPPRAMLPEPITDLQAALDMEGVTLTWTFPARLLDGTDLDRVGAFELEAAVMPAAEFCDGCPVRFGQATTIPADPLPTAGKRPRQAWRVTGLKTGYHYLFRVRSRIGLRQLSDTSNTVSFVWHQPGGASE